MNSKRLLRTTAISILSAGMMVSTAFAGELTILSTSDVHGSIIGWNYFTAKPADVGLAKVSTIVRETRAKLTPNDDMLLVDVGDILQGTPLDTYMVQHPTEWKTHPMFDAYNKIGYDAIVCGNHEFSYGLDYLKKAIGQNKNVLAANLMDKKTGKIWKYVQPYVIRDVKIDGETVRVGIIGTVTPGVPKLEPPSHYEGVTFKRQVPAIRDAMKELKAKNVDIIVAASHSGVEGAYDSDENEIVSIAKACPELSLLIAAHNHVVIDNKSGVQGPDGTVYSDSVIHGVPIVESGKDGKFVGKSDLTIRKVNGKWKVENVTTQAVPVRGVKDDPDIVRQVQLWHEKTIRSSQQVIGEATDAFYGAESNHQDSAIVDFVNNVQRYYAGTQLSAAAALNTSMDIAKGPITLQEISGLYIYENYLYGIKISGAELRKYMEHAASFYRTGPDFNYDMIQGVTYTIDPHRPIGQRITKLQYQGREVKADDTFTLAINDYRFHGGGGYMDAMGYTNGRKPEVVFESLKKYGDDGQMRTLLVNYIKEYGTITPECDHNWNVIP